MAEKKDNNTDGKTTQPFTLNQPLILLSGAKWTDLGAALNNQSTDCYNIGQKNQFCHYKIDYSIHPTTGMHDTY